MVHRDELKEKRDQNLTDYERLTVLVEKSVAGVERANDRLGSVEELQGKQIGRLNALEENQGRMLAEFSAVKAEHDARELGRKKDLKITGYAGTSIATAIALIVAELIKLVAG